MLDKRMGLTDSDLIDMSRDQKFATCIEPQVALMETKLKLYSTFAPDLTRYLENTLTLDAAVRWSCEIPRRKHVLEVGTC